MDTGALWHRAVAAIGEEERSRFEIDRHQRNLRWLLDGMAAIGNERDAPIRVAYSFVGDRWSSLILHLLSGGSLRHGELRRLIEIVSAEHEISQRQLTLKLRVLEREGFVSRVVTPGPVHRVDYAMTELGAEFYEHLAALTRWLQQSNASILQARQRYLAHADEETAGVADE